jgi:glucose/arabinose dehydrogenase
MSRHLVAITAPLLILIACSTPAPQAAAPVTAPPVASVAPAASAVPLPTTTPRPANADNTESAPFDPSALQIVLAPVATGFDSPVLATNAADGSQRLFIVEKPGRVRVLQNAEMLASPFLDITDRVGSRANEQGLLGLAFPPNFSETGHFFVNYTDLSGNTVISRFTVPSDSVTADPTSETIVLRIQQPAPNHNGGNLAFGPEGYLYVGTGDGGASNDRFANGQNPSSLLGKMLRLDVTTDPTVPYSIPSDNPWVTADWQGVDVRDEVWALGLRNPWRYSFDAKTGDLWIADVGQNQYEEINFVEAGAPGGINFGWPIMEASHCFNSAECNQESLHLPVLEYDHAGSCSVTGGHVYRGQAYAALEGVYFFADYCSGTIWAAYPTQHGDWQTAPMLETGMNISSFGVDENGEIYAVAYGGDVSRIELK